MNRPLAVLAFLALVAFGADAWAVAQTPVMQGIDTIDSHGTAIGGAAGGLATLILGVAIPLLKQQKGERGRGERIEAKLDGLLSDIGEMRVDVGVLKERTESHKEMLDRLAHRKEMEGENRKLNKIVEKLEDAAESLTPVPGLPLKPRKP